MADRRRARRFMESDTDKQCPVCGWRLTATTYVPDMMIWHEGMRKIERRRSKHPVAYVCGNCDLYFDAKLKESGVHYCPRQLKYVFGNGATGMSPCIWSGKHYKFYSDNTIEFERHGCVYGKDEDNPTNISSVRTFKLSKTEMARLEELLREIIEALKNDDDHVRVLDGGIFSISEYDNTQLVNSFNSQNYEVSSALKELFRALEAITHSESSNYRVGEYEKYEYLLKKRQSATNKVK